MLRQLKRISQPFEIVDLLRLGSHRAAHWDLKTVKEFLKHVEHTMHPRTDIVKIRLVYEILAEVKFTTEFRWRALFLPLVLFASTVHFGFESALKSKTTFMEFVSEMDPDLKPVLDNFIENDKKALLHGRETVSCFLMSNS